MYNNSNIIRLILISVYIEAGEGGGAPFHQLSIHSSGHKAGSDFNDPKRAVDSSGAENNPSSVSEMEQRHSSTY